MERQRRYAQQLRRRRPARWRNLNEPRRTLEMVCFLHVTLLQTVDLALSLVDLRITDIRRDALARVRNRAEHSHRSLWNIMVTAVRLAEDATVPDPEFRRRFLSLMPNDVLRYATRAEALRRELAEDQRVRVALSQIATLRLEGPPELPAIEALSEWMKLRRRPLTEKSELPVDIDVPVPRSWSHLVHGADRKLALRAFEAATLLSVQKAMRNGSVWASTSLRYRSREQMFIPGEQWQRQRREHYQRLRLPLRLKAFLDPQLAALQAGLEGVADALARGDIAIDEDGVHPQRLVAEGDDRPVVVARNRLYREIGMVQLPDLIVEIDCATRFSWALLRRPPTSAHELLVLYGALLAHGTAMNAGGVALMITGVAESSIAEAMQFLEHDDAIREANERVVNYLRSHPVVGMWGKGQTASSDSMSLQVSRQLWNARVDPRRGTPSIGIYTHLLDQWAIIYDQPVVLGQRQAGAAIEGVIRQTVAESIEWLAVDTHGYTDVAMGLAKLLGFDLCPRLKELRNRTLHVPPGTTVPETLESIVRQDVSLQHLHAQWDELVRMAVSVESGQVSAVHALQRFGSAARGDPIHKAATALGQLQRSLFLCDYFTNAAFRRELSRQLYYGEALHTLQRAIHFGSVGAARGRRHEELVAISGSLTLLTNLVLAWNTHHTQRILRLEERREKRYLTEGLLRHIPPVSHRHINFQGEFRFPIASASQDLVPILGQRA